MTESSPPGRLLVVCTGNICRSPYLELVLRKSLDDAWGSERIVVSSAGTRGLVDHPMQRQAAEQLRHLGVASGDFRARRLTAEDVKAADLVLTVTTAHRAAVTQLHPLSLRYAVSVAELALASEALPTASAHEPNLPGWLRSIGQAVVAHRPKLAGVPREELDILDPYGHDDAAYVAMVEQISHLLPTLVASLSPSAAAEGASSAVTRAR